MGTFLVRVWSGSRCSEWLSHYGEELRGLCSLLRERRRASQIPILNAGKHSDPGKENLKPQCVNTEVLQSLLLFVIAASFHFNVHTYHHMFLLAIQIHIYPETLSCTMFSYFSLK